MTKLNQNLRKRTREQRLAALIQAVDLNRRHSKGAEVVLGTREVESSARHYGHVQT